jgi:hypothetical protein
MQGGQSCYFHQTVAALPFSYNFVWSSLPLARWGNPVLNAALYPRDQLQIHYLPCFERLSCCPTSLSPLFFSRPLLGVNGSSGRWACHPTLTLSLYAALVLCWVLMSPWEVGLSPHSHSQPLLLYPCYFTESPVLRFLLLAPPLFSKAVSELHPHFYCQC